MSGAKQRKNLFNRFNGHCFWCGRQTRLQGRQSSNFATVDHIYPRQDDRRRSLSNEHSKKVLSCHSCNQLRGDMSFEEFGVVAVFANQAARA